MIDLEQLSDLEILALTIIGEARGEPIEGQVAVGNVVRNRSWKYRKSISEICLAPKQFSCWNEHDPNRQFLEDLAENLINGDSLDVRYKQCLCVARGILEAEIQDNINGSLNYLTIDLFDSPNRPKWANGVTFAVIKGNQIFFTARKADDKTIIEA